MQLRYEQLAAQLNKTLSPLYWLSGDVPFLSLEAQDTVRTAATKQGFTERLVFHVENNFSWDSFLQQINTFSLFASKQLLELRLYQSLNDAGKKALQNFAKNPPKDKIVLISSAKIEAQTQKTQWFQAIINAGIFVPLWPITVENLPRWVAARAASKNVKLEPAACELLATLGEGNLLAIAQEIEKLQLLYANTPINLTMAMEAISDHARFDIFQLSDAVLNNNPQRILRIITLLQAEGTEAILVLWALTREIRNLLAILHYKNSGMTLDQALQKQKIWDKQKPLIQKALQHHTINSLQLLLQQASKIDGMIKGVVAGNVWNELQQLGLNMGGTSCLANP